MRPSPHASPSAAAIALIAASLPAQGASIHPGETRWGLNRYVEYVVGNAPIVVSSAHGGDLRPPSIPDRTWGVTAQDRRTQETARELADHIAGRTGRRPHLVISHLHRIKLDPNRDIVEGAQGNPIAEQAWRDFHGFCAAARAAAQTQWGRGMYLDVHGHGHPEAWVELGYALSAVDLAQPDPVLAQQRFVDASTIRALGSQPSVWFPEVLRGSTSLGGFLQSAGFNSVPSPVNPHPAGGNYFTGGFNVRRYGSRDGGTVDGVQIELPFSIRRDRSTRAPFNDRTTDWLEALFISHHPMPLSSDPRITVTTRDGVASETGGAAAFRFHRTGDLSASTTVSFALAGTATAAVDYAHPGSSVLFPAGIAMVDLPLTALDDNRLEGDETVEIRLLGGIETGSPSRATALVLDDEGEPRRLAHLPFEETSGAIALDVTGNGHDGALRPSASQGPARVLERGGRALRFDGGDDHVRIPDFSYAPNGDFTVAFWFKTSATTGSGFQYMLSHAAFGVPHSLNVYFSESTGRLRTALVFGNDITDTDVLDIDRDLRDGTWHFYTLVARDDDLTRVYIDGSEEAVALFAGNAFDPSGDLFLGGRSDLDPQRFFRGSLDDLQIWRDMISGSEVRALYAGLGREAAVHPGTGDDLDLATGVNGAPTSGPRADVKTANGGDRLFVHWESPGGTLTGSTTVLGGQLFATGNPPHNPLFPEVHLSITGALVIAGPASLPPAGASWSVDVPAVGFAGSSLMLQAFALTGSSASGGFAASDAHELRIR